MLMPLERNGEADLPIFHALTFSSAIYCISGTQAAQRAAQGFDMVNNSITSAPMMTDSL